jgi:UDPglucose 6-dehydrogenase
MTLPKVAYCGMTHLGLNSALASAARNFETFCFDQNEKLIEELNNGIFRIDEPDFESYYQDNQARLEFSCSAKDLANCDIVYISADVPTDDNGKSDLKSIKSLLNIVEKNINEGCIVVILSQVSPGFTRENRLKNTKTFYQVETLIFGRAIERAMFPERFIVGTENPESSLPEKLQIFLGAYDCPILPMRYESAELAKISINMCLVASISVANSMAEICENIGADWFEIIPALRLDRRIGDYSYISPGLGISGGNLERDLESVVQMSDKYKTDGNVIKSWIENSKYRKNWPYRMLNKLVLSEKKNPNIAVLGLSYKENTNSIKNSPAVMLIDQLNSTNVNVYDPLVKNIPNDSHVNYKESAYDAVHGADVLLVMTPWDEFKELSITRIAEELIGNIVIDPYRVFEKNDVEALGLKYNSLGITVN